MRLHLVIVAMLVVLLSGCDAVDSLKEGLAHSEAVSSSLEKSLGSKPFVGFNWNNGSLTSVSITFKGIPPNVVLADIAGEARTAVLAEFKQTPKQVVIAFSIEP
jgi:hypothetical protein